MEKDQRTIIIKNVRVSFPHLFEQPMINGELGSCGARLMLDPSNAENAGAIKQVQQIITKLIEEMPGVAGLASDKLCLRQDPSRAEYEGMWLLSANSKKAPNRWSSCPARHKRLKTSRSLKFTQDVM